MKNTKHLTAAMLIAIAMPMISPALAGPEHNHDHDHAVTTKAPAMDAKAKKIWDRSIEATMSENASEEWVKSMRMEGTMSMPAQGISAEMNILIANNKGMHVSITIPGMGSFEQGVSGDVVWSNSMMEGPKILEGAEAQQYVQQNDLYADLHWEKYYDSISYKGEITITMPDGTEMLTHTLELDPVDKDEVTTNYYSDETGRLARSDAMAAGPGGALMPTSTYTTDYREVEGMHIPFYSVTNIGPMKQIIEFTEVEVNSEIAEGELDLPEDIKELLED